MGRTVRPVRYEVEARLCELKKYLTALRKEDKYYFDRLYADVMKHVSAISYAHPLQPTEVMLWSALLELEKKIEKLQKRV